jgi:hypothetical protein
LNFAASMRKQLITLKIISHTMTTFLKKALFVIVAFVCAFQLSAQTAADGFAAMQLEDWDKAINIYGELVKKDPVDQASWLSLGSAYTLKGNKAKAKEAYDAAFNAKPEGAYGFIANARNAFLQNNITVVDEQLKKAAKAGKKDPVAMRLIGETYLFTEPGVKPNFVRAEALLKEAYDASPKNVQVIMALAYCYNEMPNGGEAARYYELAEQLEARNPLIKYRLARVYKAGKIYPRFLDYCDRAVSVAPNYTPALRAKAEYLYFARKWEDATAAYKELVANGAELRIEDEMQLANCLFITKDCKGCSELVEKILKKDGTKNYLRRLQAYCDYENGEFKRGMDQLNDYFKMVQPEKIIASDYLYLGRFMVKTGGDTSLAAENMKKSIALDSMSWPLYKEVAELYTRQRNYCGAADSWKMYMDSVSKQDPNDYYRWGIATYFCKDDSLRYQKSEKIFMKLEELSPQATLGWLWAGKSAKNAYDPSAEAIAADPEKAKEYGKARTHWEKYVEVAYPTKDKYKKDLADVLEYLSYCYFVSREVEKFNDATAKWREVDPDDLAKIDEMVKEFNTPQPEDKK